MPTVPTYDTPQVAPAGLPNVQLQGLSPRQLMQGEIAGHEQEQAGQNIQNLGVQGMNEDAKQQMLANQTRVDAALNDVRAAQQKLTYDPDQGYLAKTGADAVKPNDQGQGLQDVYGSKLQDAISNASANLANDAQRQVFAKQAAQLSTQFDGQIMSHVLSENRKFGLETQQGTIDLEKDSAEKNWNNPDMIDNSIASVKAAVWKAGQISGDPANLIDAKTLQQTSAIHTSVINAALQNNNPEYAQSYIEKYKDDMTAGDLLKARGQITGDMNARIATGTVQTVLNNHQNALSPTMVDRMLQITKQAESVKGDFNPDGTPVTNTYTKPDGTIGTARFNMQTTDDTAGAPGHGIAPAASQTPAEYNRVGTQLLAELTKKYAGDPSKAWAAYNWGEGNVDAAIKKDGNNWLADAPPETQTYVQKNVAALQSGTGAPPLPTISQLTQEVRDRLGPNASPQVIKAATDEMTRQYNETMKSRTEQGEQAVQQAQQYLIQNHGDFNSMPPDLAAAVQQYAPGKWDNLQQFAKGVANPPKADNMDAYLTATQHPDELAKMSDADFSHFVTTNFSEGTQKQLNTLRENLLSGKNDQSAEAINTKAMTNELNNRLTALGIDTKPKDGEGKQQLGTITKFIQDGIFEQQKQLGRKMSPEEVTQYIDNQFSKNYNFRNTFMGISGGLTQTPYMQMKVSDIPSDQVDQVKASLAKYGNNNPSNDQIMRTWWRVKMANNG